MSVTKVSSKQIVNNNLPQILSIGFNNGTGTRSTNTPGGGQVIIPGATGDTTYTAPSDTNVDIHFTMTMMVLGSVASNIRVYAVIGGVTINPGTYQDVNGTSWYVQTVTFKYQVAAGATINIGAAWTVSAGTSTIVNANSDASYPCYITGIVIPRPS